MLRYRGAAMAEFWRALRTLKALQAEQAAEVGPALEAHPTRPAPRPAVATRPQPNQPERAVPRRLEQAAPALPVPGRTLHDPAAPWLPKEPEPAGETAAGSTGNRTIARTGPHRMRATDSQGRMDRMNKCRTNG